jgi:hypothetical protein
MSKPKKIAFHTRTLSQSLGIREINESTIQLMVDALIANYQEYALEPKIKFRLEVENALKNCIMPSEKVYEVLVVIKTVFFILIVL